MKKQYRQSMPIEWLEEKPLRVYCRKVSPTVMQYVSILEFGVLLYSTVKREDCLEYRQALKVTL